MKNNYPTVTVGIAAYNEEKNIKNVLSAVLKQKQLNWRLAEIILACDGCTDNTVKYARSICSNKIKLIVSNERLGKAQGEQTIINAFKGDYLVMLDADITLTSNSVIEQLIAVFRKDRKVALVGGNPRALTPKTFVEKAVYSTFLVLDKSRKFVKDGNNIYGCSGQCLAMERSFAKLIKFPKNIVAEDDFIYFTCISKGMVFRHCKKAVVYYKLPKTLNDYLRQIFRSDPDASTRNVEKYFGDIVSMEYHRPLFPYMKAVMVSFIQNPLGSLLMICIRLLSKPVGSIVSNNYKLDWFTASSTK